MKKVTKFLVVLVIMLLTAAVFAACNNDGGSGGTEGPVKLSAPKNLQVCDTYITWDIDAKAKDYVVSINDKEFVLRDEQKMGDKETGRVAHELGLAPETYQIKVKAKGDGKNYTDSDWTDILEFTAGLSYNSISDGYEVSKGDTYNLDRIVIPAVYNGQSVKKIADTAFGSSYSGSKMSSIVIPSSVTSIGNYAFSFCSNLEDITIPNGVEFIGDSAFSSCTSLKSVTLPNGLISILDSTFSYCSSLTDIVIPNSVTSIGSSAFDGCSSLKSVTIPNNVLSIGNYAFRNCNSLTIYSESASTTWSANWNSSSRPVCWGCQLSSDKTYVTSFIQVIGYNHIFNPSKFNITEPYRKGYSFGGWATNADGSGTLYPAASLGAAVETYSSTLYAVWIKI